MPANPPSGYARAIGNGISYIDIDNDGTVTLGGSVSGTTPFKFNDNVTLKFGDSNDITMGWDGTDFDILQLTANSSIKFGVSGAGIDLVLYGDTAGRNLTWDQSADALIFEDSAKLVLGTGSDIVFTWDGTDLDVTQATVNSSIKWGVDGAGIDHVFYGDTASVSATWDQSADSLLLNDNAKLVFGTGSDVTIAWDATDLDITAAADDSVLKIGNGTNSFDLWLYGNTASDYVLWDASAGKLSLVGAAYIDLGGSAGHYRHTMRTLAGNDSPTMADSGSVYSVTAACEITLPAVATSAGFYAKYINAVDEILKITAPANTMVTFNDATATSVSYEQTGEQIGNGFEVFCDGSFYYVLVLAQEASTLTVA